MSVLVFLIALCAAVVTPPIALLVRALVRFRQARSAASEACEAPKPCALVLSVIGAAAAITTAIWNIVQILKARRLARKVVDAALLAEAAAAQAALVASRALEDLAHALAPARKPRPKWTQSRQIQELAVKGEGAATTIQRAYRKHRSVHVRYGAFEFNIGEES
ncbi:hypothetical protein T492DRAFT_866380 [Pavlovales sp. CCMP2436]|nr:hypothetical protein T492DRAFT_866380 [Pavlovales sp. CCMP2436]